MNGTKASPFVQVSEKTLGWLAGLAGVKLEKASLDGIVCCKPNPAIQGYSCVDEQGQVVWNAANYKGPIPKPCGPGGGGTPPATPSQPAPSTPNQLPSQNQGPVGPTGPTSPMPEVPSCCTAYWSAQLNQWYMTCSAPNAFGGHSGSEGPATPSEIASWNVRCAPSANVANPVQAPVVAAPGGGGGVPWPLPLPQAAPPAPPAASAPAPAPGTPPSPGVPVSTQPWFPKPPTPAPGTPGIPRPQPTAGVSVTLIEKVLASVEDAWHTALQLVVRADRCSATAAEKAARDQALACLEAFRQSAGAIRQATTELCLAKTQNRDARLTSAQIAAIEALALCVSKITSASVQATTGTSPDWLKAIVGTGLPAAGVVAMHVL